MEYQSYPKKPSRPLPLARSFSDAIFIFTSFMPTTFPRKLLRARSLAFAAVLLVGVAAGVGASQLLEHHQAACRHASPPSGELVKPGPWGELSCAPFTIAA